MGHRSTMTGEQGAVVEGAFSHPVGNRPQGGRKEVKKMNRKKDILK